ncbi:hypothetical protein [Mesorhizobium sp. SP-1A]|uniref:hypothetical protein n=1 Tax=Mesorhizobium sp. SP-1A TaxID=3077840 RepID=UPI0028F70738|nr:hypothetical protein [Mesorhizobium sp. SP-1A]
MGYEIAWKLTSDLTKEEVAEVKEIYHRNIRPGLQAMSLRKRDMSEVSLFSKFAFFLFVQKKNAKYYSRSDSAVFSDLDIAVGASSPAPGSAEALIPFKAGLTRTDVLGAQQTLTMALLASISSVSNKARLIECEASSLNDVKIELKLIEKHSGIKFRNLDTFFSEYEDFAEVTPMLI